MIIDKEQWKELTGVDIEMNIKTGKEQAIQEKIKSMNYDDLEMLISKAQSELDERVQDKIDSLKVGTAIKKPSGNGSIYYLIIDIYTDFSSDTVYTSLYETKVEYAIYYKHDNGKVLYRDKLTYPLDEFHKAVGIMDPGVEILHTNYEEGVYEDRLNDLMIDIFNKAIQAE